MTFSDQVMILTLRQIFKMTFQGQIIGSSFDAETRRWQNKCRAFTESKVVTEKKNSQKRLFDFLVFFLEAGCQTVDLGSNLRMP